MTGFVPVLRGVVADRPDELDCVRNADLVAGVLRGLGYSSDVVAVDIDLTEIERLAAREPLVAFNLVEGIRGDGGLAPLACAALDHFAIRYTGAATAAFTQSTSKLMTKALLRSAGLPTPDWWLGAAPAGHRVIVKSVSEHASCGMDQGSVVDGAEAAAEIARRRERFGGRFFCEEFIDGREFNVSVIELADGPHVLPLAETRFDLLPQGTLAIVDYAAKWDEASPAYHLTPRRFGLLQQEPELARRIVGLTLDCWHAADLAGYARVDFRVAPGGGIHILEFNANPCLAPDAGFAAALQEAGIAYEEAIEAIVRAARRTKRH